MKRNVIEYLEHSAIMYPEKMAVIDEKKGYTYSELLMISRHIGSAVATKSKMRMPVAVLAEKNSDTLACFMGIVQAGCFYTLLNPELPKNRIEQIISILQPAVIITDYEHIEQAEHLFSKDKILLIERIIEHEEDIELLNKIRSKLIDTDPLYVNFTSGSTGIQKGVVVSHKSVLDFIDIFAPMFLIDETDIIGNQAPFDFDVSVKDIYSTFKTGATLVIIPRRLFAMPIDLINFICEHKITTLIWAVSALCLISTFHVLEYRVPKSIKRVLFSGEIMPYKHLLSWMDHLPNATFVNLYGPTEITCNCTYHRINRDRNYYDGIPIGTAFPNEDVFLLSEENEEIIEPNNLGEICVRGSALALGYFGNPTQTEKAFPNNPLNSWYQERIYRTGDLGKYTEERELVFCGRKDFQIKYKGHRIELEEIELTISIISGVDRCCVIFNETKQKLYGFYIGSIDKKQLHSMLKGSLPVYMVPGVLRQIDSFPLTKNGKIDRKKLLEEL